MGLPSGIPDLTLLMALLVQVRSATIWMHGNPKEEDDLF